MATKIRRTSVMIAGLTLATGAVIGVAAPASAASASAANAPVVQGTYHHQSWHGYDDDDWDFRGLYNSRWSCENEGRQQTRSGWGHDDYVCVRSDRWRPRWDNNRWGKWKDRWNHGDFRHGGAWALYVED